MLHDALTVLQRAELVTRMAVEIERDTAVEPGTEGRLIEMQLEETMVGVWRATRPRCCTTTSPIPSTTPSRWRSTASQDFPIRTCWTSAASEMLGYDRKVNTLDYPVSPQGS